MIIRIGNFLFHYRNGLFPVAYVLLFFQLHPILADYRIAAAIGFAVALTGQIVRGATVGLDYIIRGGRDRRVYAERLVQGGIFAHCRNPLYVGNILILLGVGFASNSLLFYTVGIPFFLFAYWAIIAAEENFLRGKFGEEFDRYCQRVNRLWPKFSGLGETINGMEFHWKRLISAEYGSAYLWLAAFLLVTLKNAWQAGDYRPTEHFLSPGVIALAVCTVGYGVARFWKKTGRLEDSPAS